DSVPAETQQSPGFLFVVRISTWAWVIAFAVMTISAFIPPLVEGDATIKEGDAPLSIIGYWVVPYIAMGLAAIISFWFPHWFVKSIDELQAPPAAGPVPAAATAPPAPDRPRVDGMELRVEPQEVLLDTPVAISVRGVPAGAAVTMTASAVDLAGYCWQSTATFTAGADGAVDAATQAPVAGSYEGADAMGLIWSMRFASEGVVPDIFIPSQTPITVALRAVAGDQEPMTTTIVRQPMSPGVVRSDVREANVIGTLYMPAGSGPHPGVALFSGSEGGLDSQAQSAALLASHGYAALVVGYFGAQGLPGQLVQIPLERLADGIRWLRAHPNVDEGRVGALAISRGAEGLLATAARIPDVGLRAIVAISPSEVVWQAVGDQGEVPHSSSWTLGGADLPFVPMLSDPILRQMLENAILLRRREHQHRPSLLHLTRAYAPSLKDTRAVEAAAIPVEVIQAPLLCLTGAADQVWPSGTMAEAILRRRAAAGLHYPDHHEAYAAAGHLIRMPYIPTDVAWTNGIAFGGTAAGLAAAQTDAGPRILRFFDEQLKWAPR
ncbi:MAG: acyl-CoA thioesterase/BAAT N-terminal domain-containing protein, partial [Dehalococcoidia bacterium]